MYHRHPAPSTHKPRTGPLLTDSVCPMVECSPRNTTKICAQRDLGIDCILPQATSGVLAILRYHTIKQNHTIIVCLLSSVTKFFFGKFCTGSFHSLHAKQAVYDLITKGYFKWTHIRNAYPQCPDIPTPWIFSLMFLPCEKPARTWRSHLSRNSAHASDTAIFITWLWRSCP